MRKHASPIAIQARLYDGRVVREVLFCAPHEAAVIAGRYRRHRSVAYCRVELPAERRPRRYRPLRPYPQAFVPAPPPTRRMEVVR